MTESVPMPWLTCLFGFRGRLGRLRYFGLTVLSDVFVGVIFLFTLYLIRRNDFLGAGIVGIAGVVVITWAQLALVWKRWHDLGIPGVFAIGVVLFWATVPLMQLVQNDPANTWVLNLCAVVLALYLLIARGNAGPNRYGQGPNRLG